MRWFGLFLNISTKSCLIWSAAFRKQSCSPPPLKNFWPLFAAGSFPTSLSPWPGFKGHHALPFDNPHQLYTSWLGIHFSPWFISIHSSHLICVSADHRGSMDWPLQDASDQFSFRTEYKLLITPGTQTWSSPKVSHSLQKNLNGLVTPKDWWEWVV